MRALLIRAALALPLSALPVSVLGDPIHRVENDAYWHHDSGWVFPQRVGTFVREGAAQDVAGSRDAVAHYVRTFDGVRVVVDVDVFPSDSSAEQVTFDAARAALVTAVDGAKGQLAEDSLELGKGIEATRVRFIPAGNRPAEALYFIVAGEWRVRIRAGIPASAHEVASELDAFVQGQRWDTLMPHLPGPSSVRPRATACISLAARDCIELRVVGFAAHFCGSCRRPEFLPVFIGHQTDRNSVGACSFQTLTAWATGVARQRDQAAREAIGTSEILTLLTSVSMPS